jgi:hypothetical protein
VVEASSGAAKENLVPFGIAAAEPTSDLPDGKVPEAGRGACCSRACRCWPRAGDCGMVEATIRKAIELKHPARDHVDDEPERPRPSGKRGGIREIYTAGGYAMRLTTARTPTRSARMRRSMHDAETLRSGAKEKRGCRGRPIRADALPSRPWYRA